MKITTYVWIIVAMLLYFFQPEIFSKTYGIAIEKSREYIPVAYNKIQAMISK